MKYLGFAGLLSFVLATAGCGDSGETNATTGAHTATSSGGATASGAGGGGGGGGEAVGAGAGGSLEPGQPLDTPEDQWTFVPFDDAYCADGTPTGIGVNRSTKSKNVAIYLEGGGACWDYTTCYLFGTASNLAGYGQANFDGDEASILNTSLFRRDDASNAFKDWSFVYVPYCTGDVHAGNKVASYSGKQTMHVGYANFTAYLKRIIATWGEAPTVLISGSSAGGYGAAFNWYRTQQAMPASKVYLLDDSGPALPSPYADGREPLWRAAWDLDSTLPSGCTGCKDHMSALVPFALNALGSDRGALLSYLADTVIPVFYGISTTQFEAALGDVEQSLDAYPNAHYFVASGSGHALLADVTTLQQGGVSLESWLAQITADDPGWASVKP